MYGICRYSLVIGHLAMLTRCLKVFLLCALVANAYGASVDNTYDTIVVGLGSAGTTAATTLARAGRRVLALEAQGRIGGRVHTFDLGDKGVVELGAEWIHGTHPSRVYDAAVSANVPVQMQNFTFKAYQSDGSLVDTTLIDQILSLAFEDLPNLPPKEPTPVGKYTREMVVEYLGKHRPDVIKDEEFLKNILHYLDLTINTLEASNDPDDVIAGGDYEELEGSRGTSWHKYGYKTFFEILLNTYNNGPGLPTLKIKLDTEVTQIKYPQDPNEDVEVTTKDGTVYRAKNVIVTVSLGVLKERHTTLFSTPLPKEKVEAIDKISMGLLGKMVLYFDEPYWPSDKNIFYSLFWKNEDKQKLAEKDRWILNVTGPSLSMGNDHTLTLWTSGNTMKHIETLPEEEIVDNCMNYLNKLFSNRTTRPSRLIRTTWYKNPFTRGTYTFDNLLMAQYPHLRRTLAQPLTDTAGNPRILFAGEATNEPHYGTVHGASETGYREALRLLPAPKQ